MQQEITRVDFLTLAQDDRLNKYFRSMSDIHILDEDRRSADVGYTDTVVDYFREMIEFIRDQSYDIVHILQIDNVLIESAIVLKDSVSDLSPIIAQINGSYFGNTPDGQITEFHKLVSKLLSSPLSPVIETWLNKKKSSSTITELSLHSCLNEELFSHLLVHTSAAREYLLNLTSHSIPVTLVPEPSTVNDPGFSKREARQRVGLDTEDPVLLFFGGLREEKGIGRLLQALKTYNGRDFTLLVAGPEETVTREVLQEAKSDIALPISTDIRYINSSEQYFIASDGVICPYLDEFGERRTSHVLQEAIRLETPIIAPSFGSFEARLNNYDLGVLYRPNTPQKLNEAISKFVDKPGKWYSTEDMAAFTNNHSLSSLCSTLTDVYHSSIQS